jgi:thymidylate synthase
MGESQYLDLMKKIMETGSLKHNRTGSDTKSLFGNMMRFKLQNNAGQNIIPLLTTKKMTYRLIVEELLWFLSGSTNAKKLHDKKVYIWDANTDKKQLDATGFSNYEEGDAGAAYGFQWRHFGADYENCDTNYEGKGTDQVSVLIDGLIKNPTSRRHIISAWNPSQLHKIVLPPCHILAHFNVEDKYLDCLVYQRSADVPLGVPFNIASYATLTHMIAQQTNLIARDFIYTTGDTHIYQNQLDGCLEQITREPYESPLIVLDKASDIFHYTWNDFHLQNYKCHSAINYPLSV